jgi:hypothetical protein
MSDAYPTYAAVSRTSALARSRAVAPLSIFCASTTLWIESVG